MLLGIRYNKHTTYFVLPPLRKTCQCRYFSVFFVTSSHDGLHKNRILLHIPLPSAASCPPLNLDSVCRYKRIYRHLWHYQSLNLFLFGWIQEFQDMALQLPSGGEMGGVLKYSTTSHLLDSTRGEILSVACGIQAFEGSVLSRAQYLMNQWCH